MNKQKGTKCPQSFVPRIVDCMNSSERLLSRAAKACFIELFR